MRASRAATIWALRGTRRVFKPAISRIRVTNPSTDAAFPSVDSNRLISARTSDIKPHQIVDGADDVRIVREFQDDGALHGNEFKPFGDLRLHADERRVCLADNPLALLPDALHVFPTAVGAKWGDLIWWLEVELH